MLVMEPVFLPVDDPLHAWGVPPPNGTTCPSCYDAATQERFWGFTAAPLNTTAFQSLVASRCAACSMQHAAIN